MQFTQSNNHNSPPKHWLYLLGIGFVAQIISVPVLWVHQSDSGFFLGRYSLGYASILLLNILLVLGWGISAKAYMTVGGMLEKLPYQLRIGLVILFGLAAFGLWLTAIESQIKQYIALNWLLIVVVFAETLPVQPAKHKWILFLVAAGVLVLLIMLFFSVLGDRFFSPDEAHWADYASSAWQAGGVYSRTWLQTPTSISPGLGWSIAVYGWALEHIAFRIETGRAWNYVVYLLAFIGIGAVTSRLYGWRAALVSVMFAALSRMYFGYPPDYRPDHQLLAGSMLIMFAALQARLGKKAQVFWNFLCGFVATFSLELHAAAIVFAVGFTLFYLLEFIYNTWHYWKEKDRHPESQRLLWFILGAGLGTGLYYYLNILPAGGLNSFLDFLVKTRWNPATRVFTFLAWPSLFEGAIILLAFLFLLRRQSLIDRLYLCMAGCVIVAVLLFDPNGGYSTNFSAIYIVPVGGMVIGIWAANATPQFNRRVIVLTCALFLMLSGRVLGEAINWAAITQWIQTRNSPPFLYEELKAVLPPYLSVDDTVVSTHQLLWTIPNRPKLISFGAEATAMQRWNLASPEMVWEKVQPTVVIDVVNQMSMSPGLQKYMSSHSFQICKQFTVQSYNIILYRPNCKRTS